MYDGLNLGALWGPLEKVLNKRPLFNDNLEIQQIYKALAERDFLRHSPRMLNSYDILTNIEVLKSALFLYSNNKLSVEDMQGALISYRLVEMKLAKLGMKLDADLIIAALRSMNKFITEKKMNKWIDHN